MTALDPGIRCCETTVAGFLSHDGVMRNVHHGHSYRPGSSGPEHSGLACVSAARRCRTVTFPSAARARSAVVADPSAEDHRGPLHSVVERGRGRDGDANCREVGEGLPHVTADESVDEAEGASANGVVNKVKRVGDRSE